MPRDIRRFDVFVQADALVLQTYSISASLPPGEQYGLQTQLRRAALSVPVNLVEGAERQSDRDFARFVEIARGSAAEVRYLLATSRRLSYVEADRALPLEDGYDHVVRALHSLGKKLNDDHEAAREHAKTDNPRQRHAPGQERSSEDR